MFFGNNHLLFLIFKIFYVEFDHVTTHAASGNSVQHDTVQKLLCFIWPRCQWTLDVYDDLGWEKDCGDFFV